MTTKGSAPAGIEDSKSTSARVGTSGARSIDDVVRALTEVFLLSVEGFEKDEDGDTGIYVTDRDGRRRCFTMDPGMLADSERTSDWVYVVATFVRGVRA